jgi:hypothetical protein
MHKYPDLERVGLLTSMISKQEWAASIWPQLDGIISHHRVSQSNDLIEMASTEYI